MNLYGNHYSALSDRLGNVTITRKRDGATVYLQGDDVEQFMEIHAGLYELEYPSGPFKTREEHVDACLNCYDDVMGVRQ